MRTLRWLAVAIAATGAIDPAVAWRATVRPRVEIRTIESPTLELPGPGALSRREQARALAADLERTAGAEFAFSGSEAPVATVLIGDRAPVESSAGDGPTVATSVGGPVSPNVRIDRASVSSPRVPGEAARIDVGLEATGVAGQTTAIELRASGVLVASERHRWQTSAERWRTTLRYLPPANEVARLRVVAAGVSGERTSLDNAVDVLALPAPGPLRVLVFDARASWATTFVRRALEGNHAFAVAAIDRLSHGIASRAGDAPSALTADALVPFDVAILGAPDDLTSSDVDALRTFVERRGGTAIFVPDTRPAGRLGPLWPAGRLEERILTKPAVVGAGALRLRGTELLVAHDLEPGSQILVALGEGTRAEPVVVAERRGEGAVILAGVMDAWRYRGGEDDLFASFWRRVVIDAGAGAPPPLEVTVDDTVVRPGSPVHIRARVRGLEVARRDAERAWPEMAASVTGASNRVSEAVRLWPSVEAGVFEGTFTPSADDRYDVTVMAVSDRSIRADAVFEARRAAAVALVDDPDGLALAALARGGESVAPASAHVVDALRRRLHETRERVAVHPMRSPWWAVAVSGLLCGEWLWRRRSGAR